MPEDRARTLRENLAHRCSPEEQEVIPMKKTGRIHKSAAALAAVLAALALSVTALAYGGQIVHHFMTGGVVTQGVDEDGTPWAEGFSDPDETLAPIESREGRWYLTIDGQNEDISDRFTEEVPYIYRCTGSDGLEHAFLIGGSRDQVGWAEFIFDENGQPTAGASYFATPDGSDGAPWFAVGKEELDLPW